MLGIGLRYVEDVRNWFEICGRC